MKKKKKHGRVDPLEIRFRLQAKRSIAEKLTSKEFNEIYRNWVKTGKVPPGFRVPKDAAEWRNKARPGKGANWRSGDNSEALDTLLERSLSATKFNISRHRARKR